MGRFIHFAIAAADEAMKMSGLKITPENAERVGVHIGSGIGGFDIIEREHPRSWKAARARSLHFLFPRPSSISPPATVSMRFGAKGPNEATATACTTSAHSIGDSFRIIQHNDADVMIAGGSEAAITPMGVGGFAAMRALSTRNDDPEKASRPWDTDRDGFVMGEGAGILVLEELEHCPPARRNHPRRIAGYGMSGDAYHMTQPAPEHEGGFRVMRNAVRDAGVSPDKVGYVNAHGTSTPIGDTLEAHAIRNFFQRNDARQLHQVHDRPSSRRRGGPGSRHHRARPARSDSASDHQPGKSGPRNRQHGLRSQPRPQSQDSNTPCPTPSASAAPTALCCSALDGIESH
jgi:3-oxoacyl-[acyl-carrier-protein] synthase II